jgi:Fic-DOC domain mobile mystery protein B
VTEAFIPAADGNTPINADELEGLIPNLATRQELNEWERENIIAAERWCFSPRIIKSLDLSIESNVRELHRRMFDRTWKWAGTYRQTEKNIGLPVIKMNEAIGALLGNFKYWISERSFSPEEISVRLHHGLVFIHPFPNGNGRHSRLAADVVSVQLGGKRLSWGRATLIASGAVRDAYISALREADGGNFNPLIEFAKS